MMSKDKWVVNTKGGYTTDDFEISVVRSSNRDGKESYGWYGNDKIMISADTMGETQETDKKFKKFKKLVWGKLVRVAKEIADELNASERASDRKMRNDDSLRHS